MLDSWAKLTVFHLFIVHAGLLLFKIVSIIHHQNLAHRIFNTHTHIIIIIIIIVDYLHIRTYMNACMHTHTHTHNTCTRTHTHTHFRGRGGGGVKDYCKVEMIIAKFQCSVGVVICLFCMYKCGNLCVFEELPLMQNVGSWAGCKISEV